ncbi:MAG TPA: hypothetical protein VGF45_10320 [Polyangia bacterium]
MKELDTGGLEIGEGLIHPIDRDFTKLADLTNGDAASTLWTAYIDTAVHEIGSREQNLADDYDRF